MRLLRETGADHAVAGHEVGQSFFAPPFGSCRTHREHEVANFGRGIPYPYVGAGIEFEAEFTQHAARVPDGSRPVGRGFVPDRRQSKDRPRIAGAQCTDDHVVLGWRILNHDDVLALPAGIAQFADCRRAVMQQPRAIFRIAPCPSHDLRAVARADLGFIGLDQNIQCGRIDVTLFRQDRFEGTDPKLGFREIRMVVIVGMMVMIVVMPSHPGMIVPG